MKKNTDSLHPAFVLHTRPYRDSSLLIELFTKDSGRLTAIAKGGRRPASPLKNALQLFQPVFVAWVGKHELVTLTHAEMAEFLPMLTGERCWCGMYLNELLMYLIERHDPYPQLFQLYYQTMIALMENKSVERALRYFEKSLLAEIGYGLELRYDLGGHPIEDDSFYQFVGEKGAFLFQKIVTGSPVRHENCYQGKNLLALYKDDLNDEASLKTAKYVLRQALTPLLGHRTLKSREMFNSFYNLKVKVKNE